MWGFELLINTIIVTGAMGMIGRRLVPFLLSKGHNVVASDRTFDAGLQLPASRIVIGDLNDADVCEAAITATNGDKNGSKAIVHLAGTGSVTDAKSDPLATINNNIVLIGKVLSAALKHNVRRFIFISSSLVYGRGGREPVEESVLPGPVSLYGATKLAAESLVQGFAAEFNLSCEIARLSNVYGRDNPANTVIGRILQQIRQKQKIEVLSREPVRDFIFIDDVVSAIYQLLTVTDQPGCIISNISSGVGTSIGEVVDIAKSIAEMKPNPSKSYPSTDDSLVLSNKFMKQRTGWRPLVSISDGFLKCL